MVDLGGGEGVAAGLHDGIGKGFALPGFYGGAAGGQGEDEEECC